MTEKIFTVNVKTPAKMNTVFNERHQVEISVSYYADEKEMALKELDRCVKDLKDQINE